MRRRVLYSLVLILCPALAAQETSGGRQTVEIAARDGQVTGTLFVPAVASGKVPVTILIAGSGEFQEGGLRSLSQALAQEGIAALRYVRRDPPGLKEGDAGFESAVADAAACVSFLRNDSRFSTITVAAFGDAAAIGTVAARLARADAVTTPAEIETPPVVKAVRDLDLPGVVLPRRNTGQRASLRDTTIATISGSRIGIEYGRPSKRTRVIWGNLVKWGGWWMPGADESTTLTTTHTLVFGSLEVPKGDYTIYTAPSETTFTLIVSGETGQFHTVYHPERDLGRVPMTQEPTTASVERLTFSLEPRDAGGVLKLTWDDRSYVAAFTVRNNGVTE